MCHAAAAVSCVDPVAAPCHLPCMSADPSLRNVKAWPFEEAAKVADRLAATPKTEGGARRLFETGYGPSGLPHIGTFGEVARTTWCATPSSG